MSGCHFGEKEREQCQKKFPFKEGQTEVLFAQILYIESKLHKLEFHILENEKYEFILCTEQ